MKPRLGVEGLRLKRVSFIQDERRVLKKLKFPLIIEFYRTYKDEANIYFLTEYIQGMELFDVIREIGT